ncbi:MAG: asparagine synthase-related protein, partial [bacterium]
AASIESRVPFLDHELVEFVFRVPSKMKIKNATGKYLLKKLAESKLPSEVIYRKKMGFPVPLKNWFLTGGLKEQTKQILFDESTKRHGHFNINFLEQHFKDIERGILGQNWDSVSIVWSLLNFELWYRIFIEKSEYP